MDDNTIELHWHRYARNRPKRCPHCGSEKLVPMVYGLPDDDMIEAAKQGRISLGGCMVTDRHPAWSCTDCHKGCGKVVFD